MNKIKISELFQKMVIESQKAFASEDETFNNAIKENIDVANLNVVSLRDVLMIVQLNNEFLRISTIKALCNVLDEYGILERDVDIKNIDVTNQMLESGVKKAIEEINS